jgi:DNA-binding winged helix-turn-helix (wHTH) protein
LAEGSFWDRTADVAGGLLSDSRRRWRFADAAFDEDSWTLSVDGVRASLEMKPLLLLRTLLLHAGSVVTKDDLLTAVWPEVTVVEASLTTAVMKLRRVLGEDPAGGTIIETVRGVGYRLGVPVTVEELAVTGPMPIAPHVAGHAGERAIAAASPRHWSYARAATLVALALFLVIGAGSLFSRSGTGVAAATRLTPAQLQRAGENAVRRMDLTAIERLIAAGWHPEAPYDAQDNDALKMLLSRCEWDPGHDQQRLMLVARTLIDGGSSLTHRNVWGDTAYSIAKAPRYCGADHPVTLMIHGICFSGVTGEYNPACEADYSQRRPFVVPAPG